jgi:hypothetical protein
LPTTEHLSPYSPRHHSWNSAPLAESHALSLPRTQQGPNLPNGIGFYDNNVQINPSAQFEISRPNGTPPAGLPFTPTLNAESILPGQNIATPIEALQTVGNIVPVTSVVTLEPQTIDGTVAAISNVNGQTAYQITLFNDDLITLFASTQTVAAYSTSETHTITTSPLSVGATARVRGLLFNDGDSSDGRDRDRRRRAWFLTTHYPSSSETSAACLFFQSG